MQDKKPEEEVGNESYGQPRQDSALNQENWKPTEDGTTRQNKDGVSDENNRFSAEQTEWQTRMNKGEATNLKSEASGSFKEDQTAITHNSNFQQESQSRAIFQPNREVANQALKMAADGLQTSEKKNERILNELSEAKKQYSDAKMMQESLGQGSAMKEESFCGSPMNTETIKKASHVMPIEEIRVTEQMFVEKLQKVRTTLSHSNQEEALTIDQNEKVDQNPSNLQHGSNSTSEQPQDETDEHIREIDSFKVQSQPNDEKSNEVDNEQSDDLLDAFDKENQSPEPSEEQIDKEEQIEAPIEQYMDIDKEPAFAEENLDKIKSPIIDDGSSPQRYNMPVEAGSAIKISEELIIISNMQEEREQSEKKSDKKQSVMAEEETEQPKNQDLFSTFVQSVYMEDQKVEINATPDNTGRSARNNSGSRRNQGSNMNSTDLKQNRTKIVSEQQLPVRKSNLTKRAPILLPKDDQKPITPTRPKLTPLPANNLQNSVSKTTQRPSFMDRLNCSNHQSTTPRPISEETSAKKQVKPSVPVFFKLSEMKRAELKHKNTLAKIEKEVEKVRQQRKPPVPKFNLREKSKGASNRGETSPAQLRKPPVPKFSELLKKRL